MPPDIGSSEEMNRLATTLMNSLDMLRTAGRDAEVSVDAGASTALVSRTLGDFLSVAGGMLSDIQHQADEVPKARSVYERTDDTAADGMPLPLSSDNGGN
ncbi:hypothetical protein [Actinopolyspora halophila]|uniref:hypothetical protein n=1 Tax=Actinopolyspora halophila TaxID=1850 RepID=UPI0003788E30|nr:hypothetical protein [Actinopolyspora halophila]